MSDTFDAETESEADLSRRLEELAAHEDVPLPAARNGRPSRRERRAALRTRTLNDGRILTRRADGGVDCVILDVSEHGARLRPLRSFIPPKAFALVFGDGSLRICETVWQGDVTLGVRYLD